MGILQVEGEHDHDLLLRRVYKLLGALFFGGW